MATKLPAWKCHERADFERFFGEQLERLRLPSVDFYLLHSLNADSWAQVRDLGVLDWAKKARARGRFTWFGFSFHDDLATFKEIVDATKLWDFCQIQYNYMDEDHQAGSEGLRYAARKGLGVVVMEPIRGGQLAGTPPETVAALWRRAEAEGFDGAPRTPAGWALQWVWDHAEVGPGAERHEHHGAGGRERGRRRAVGGTGRLTAAERALVAQVRDAYRELSPIACTACDYCQPCREGVKIPRIFALYNDARMYGNEAAARLSLHVDRGGRTAPTAARTAASARRAAPRSSPSPSGSRSASGSSASRRPLRRDGLPPRSAGGARRSPPDRTRPV